MKDFVAFAVFMLLLAAGVVLLTWAAFMLYAAMVSLVLGVPTAATMLVGWLGGIASLVLGLAAIRSAALTINMGH